MSFTPLTPISAPGTIALTKGRNESPVLITLAPGGTAFSGLSFTIEAFDGNTWIQVAAVDNKNPATIITGGSSISPSNNTIQSWTVPNVLNFSGVRVNVSAVTNIAEFALFSEAAVPQITGAGAVVNVNAAGTTYSSLTVTGRALATLDAIGPAPTDTFSASMTIDVTHSLHVVAASHTTSATTTMTPSAAGSAGDQLTILIETDSSGQVVTTFASTFHTTGTQTCTASTFSSITFVSDGSRWIETGRATALS